MDESVSRVGFIYGMAFVLALAKACTLFIWRTLPKARPPVRQEIVQAWRRRRSVPRGTVANAPEPAAASSAVADVAEDHSRPEGNPAASAEGSDTRPAAVPRTDTSLS